MTTIQLDTFSKLPFGGVSPKLMAQRLAAEGPAVAAADLDRARSALRPGGLSLPAGSAVLMLGGSGGILRALAIQLLFGERVPVYAIHYDSEKLQIGSHHARALMAAAAQDGVACHYVNADATRPDNVQKVVDRVAADGHRCVHLINGIAAGATKRFAEHGTAKVRDLDIAFDPLRQIADFSSWSSLRQFGLVDVDIATEADIERTYKFMGHSTDPWAEALQRAGLLIPRESLVAFTDYDYEHDDPVYALGPLSQAKVLQRQSMQRIQERSGARTVRLCYPAMNTTALGAIPGGTLMFAGTAQILLEQSVYQSIPDLARASLPVFNASFDQPELRVDLDFQRVLPEFHRRKVLMHSGNMRENFSLVFENPALLAPFRRWFYSLGLARPFALWALVSGFVVIFTSSVLGPLRALVSGFVGWITSEGLAPPLALWCGQGTVGASKPAPRRSPDNPCRPPGFNVGSGRSIENTSGATRFGVAPCPRLRRRTRGAQLTWPRKPGGSPDYALGAQG